ncbi:MAG TPA: hypothetical protein DEP66_04710 [Acidimicrobiaceae bacterium]|nr:hypothetical protein [Acidimicrobiaceae bacterium]HCB37499.1 hypothetical protein [Acidimicrobiaceae bacterium]
MTPIAYVAVGICWLMAIAFSVWAVRTTKKHLRRLTKETDDWATEVTDDMRRHADEMIGEHELMSASVEFRLTQLDDQLDDLHVEVLRRRIAAMLVNGGTALQRADDKASRHPPVRRVLQPPV